MTKEEYVSRTNSEFCGIQAFLEWIKFSDSFPPIPTENSEEPKFYEVLTGGFIEVVWITNRKGEQIKSNRYFKELLLEPELLEKSYWRYLPPHPDGIPYECGRSNP